MSSWSLEDAAFMRELAIGGADCEDIAVALKRSQADVRAMAALLSITFDAGAKLEWCDRCGSPRSWLDPKTGWCQICTIRVRTETQRIADAEEEERLAKEVMRSGNQLKKARERMRETYGANPRKGPKREEGSEV